MARAGSLEKLDRHERLLLMKFVCSFIWADLEVRDEERELVAKLVRRLHLDADEQERVQQWLEFPPAPEEVDPELIPREHRTMFLRAVENAIEVDGEISPEERETFSIFKQLLK